MNLYFEAADKIKIQLHEEQLNMDIHQVLSEGASAIVDLGKHCVGYVSLDLSTEGHHQDSPVYLQINFYEHKSEIDFDLDSYHGWISKAWIQEERIHVDVTPVAVALKRRYAFRYVKVTVLSASGNYKVSLDGLHVKAQSSADYGNVPAVDFSPEDKKIDGVSLATLHECMQEVFEDGPKRDRRLWMGDLRLQALTNYQTFKNYDLVKKCLYLFAGSEREDGFIASNVFLKPQYEGDYQVLTDYAMLFIPALYEYYEETKDMAILKELEPVAYGQFKAMKSYREKGERKPEIFPFIDWSLDLRKELAMTGVYLYSLKYLAQIERILGNSTSEIEREISEIKLECMKSYDEASGLFTCGGQISYASQVWMILGEVVSPEEGGKLLERTDASYAVKMVSPYMNHYYLEALMKTGKKEKALEYIRYYWGGMIQDGADTFYEIFNPENPEESPYGGKIVHSFCHAWSCTPSYFLRKYFNEK